MNEPLMISGAARLVPCRADSLLEAAKKGRIPFHWGDLRGQKVRLFEPQDIEAYRERVRAKLALRLAKMGGEAAIG